MAANGLFSVLQATLTLIDLMLMSMAANHLFLILTVTLTLTVLIQFDKQSSPVVPMSLFLVLMGDNEDLSQTDHLALAPINLSSLRFLMTGYPEELN